MHAEQHLQTLFFLLDFVKYHSFISLEIILQQYFYQKLAK